jgi:hypothetical protein
MLVRPEHDLPATSEQQAYSEAIGVVTDSAATLMTAVDTVAAARDVACASTTSADNVVVTVAMATNDNIRSTTAPDDNILIIDDVRTDDVMKPNEKSNVQQRRRRKRDALDTGTLLHEKRVRKQFHCFDHVDERHL